MLLALNSVEDVEWQELQDKVGMPYVAGNNILTTFLHLGNRTRNPSSETSRKISRRTGTYEIERPHTPKFCAVWIVAETADFSPFCCLSAMIFTKVEITAADHCLLPGVAGVMTL